MSIDQLREPPSAVNTWDEARRRRRGVPSPVERIGLNIALAGGAYIMTLVAMGGVFATGIALLTVMNGGSIGWPDLMFGILFGVIGLFYGGIAGLVVTIFVCLPTLALVRFTLYLLRWTPPEDHAGTFCGGLVAYIVTLPLSYKIFQPGEHDVVFALIWVLGPAMAILFGMVGGAIGGLESLRDRRRHRVTPHPRRAHRFSIAQLMVVMAALSVLLAGLRVANLLDLPMLYATTTWIVVAFLGHKPALWIARRWTYRRLRKRRHGLYDPPLIASEPTQ